MQPPVTVTEAVQGFTWLQERAGLGWALFVVANVAWASLCVWFYRRKYMPLRDAKPDVRRRLRGQVTASSETTLEAVTLVLNGASLADFRNDYRVAVMIGIDDPTIDRGEEVRMALSAAFTIVNAPITIRTPFSQGMKDVMARQIQAQRDAYSAAGVPPGVPKAMKLELAMWHEIVLLTPGTNLADVKRLSDIPRHGGLIVSREIQEQRITHTP